MTKKVKKILIGAITGVAIIVGIVTLPSGKISFCDSVDKCYTLTQHQYLELKNNLISKQERGELLTYGEYQLMVAIWNFEAQKPQSQVDGSHEKAALL